MMRNSPKAPKMPPKGKMPTSARPGKPMAKSGGKFEGSAKDEREDRKMANSRGMTMAQWEASTADMQHDTAGESYLRQSKHFKGG